VRFIFQMDRIDKLKEFIALDPGDNFSKHALGLEYIKLSNDAEARSLFEEILKNDPAYVGTYYHLGKLLERNGEDKAALEVYQNGILQAQKAGNSHALGELRSAYEELED
jgi:tetratricopeptide (TPR) repeat protein